MNKLNMETKNLVNHNIEKIGSIFPNVIVETERGFNIDVDLLKQELSNVLIEGNKEKYQLTWPGKKEAIVSSNTPTTNTLRPIKEKSMNFSNTDNIYIEGDNLEVLKILQESYLNKIKCIYIDPPYNTGKDFIYNDKFINTNIDELKNSGQLDEFGNRMVTNLQSNGKYHSDWLSMIYPRLKLSRNLLTDDGVIFISIDENEVSNLKKVCDEIFGEANYFGEYIWINRTVPNDPNTNFANVHEYILIYAKNKKILVFDGVEKELSNYKNPDNDPNGRWIADNPSAASGNPERDRFPIVNIYTNQVYYPPTGRYWAFSQKRVEEWVESGKLVFPKVENKNFILKKYLSELKSFKKPVSSIIDGILTSSGTKELKSIFDNDSVPFSYPKATELIKRIISQVLKNDDIILDFFSGSATTAHACMQLNADDNGKRKFIMVQLQEKCAKTSEAFTAGYETICEIGQERIRRAANQIKVETTADIDYGFRVYKVDSSNMTDVYYQPNELKQTELRLFEENIKEDRNSEDLLTQVILNLGLTLDLKIENKNINNNNVYFVADNSLIACFDNNININTIDEIVKYNPLKVVFRDSSFASDNDRINVEEKFKKYSPETEVSII